MNPIDDAPRDSHGARKNWVWFAFGTLAVVVTIALAVVVTALLLTDGRNGTGEASTTTASTPATPSWDSDGQDQSFLSQFRIIDGMDDLTHAEALSLAHSTCQALRAGNKMELLRVLTDRYGLAAAAKFMHLSASIYCPEQLTP